ncbi:sugar ABC transporter permease [Comamonadaceae bacterium G21597-S1]|nr:sugar ABC transporter permease [Comamonadaceae bacterium G21597-S1]
MPSLALRSSAFDTLVDRHFRHILLLPALIFLLALGTLPVLYNLFVSFQDITMLDENRSFAGALNYQRLVSDTRFWEAWGHTFLIAAIALPIQIVLGLGLGVLFLPEFPGKRVFVALMVLPTVISPIVAGASWRLMFDHQFGPVNQILGWFMGETPVILWTTDPSFVYPAIVILEVWAHTPFVFLLLLAALAQVDRSLIDAAEIDGASRWTVFRRVVLPTIRPVLFTVILIRFVDLMRLFDFIYALTQGGPGTTSETISVYMYVQGFQQFATSYTGALAFVSIVVTSILIFFLMRRASLER